MLVYCYLVSHLIKEAGENPVCDLFCKKNNNQPYHFFNFAAYSNYYFAYLSDDASSSDVLRWFRGSDTFKCFHAENEV